MEQIKTKKNVGIWLDKKKAFIMSIEDEKEKFRKIDSDLEFFRPKGGARSKSNWGPQDVIQDSKFLERENHQLKAYFDRIIKKIKKADAIAIFGPAETYLKLSNTLTKEYPKLGEKVILVSAADKMSKKQLKSMIRKFYTIE